jgi:uncharacterized protein (TIGR03435 family)
MFDMLRALGTGILLFLSSFEVASVKPHEGPMRSIGVSTSGQFLRADAADVRLLVMFAYNLRNFQIVGTAPLLNGGEARWDIVAKAESGHLPSRAEFRQMLQQLLADRFRLKVHREQHEMPVYALSVGKNLKLKESDPASEPASRFNRQDRNMVITLTKASMDDIVDAIQNTAFLDRPVVNQAAMTGEYDIKLSYSPDTRFYRAETQDPNDISVFSALQDQLGLKLERRNAIVEVLVVDKVEKPTSN